MSKPKPCKRKENFSDHERDVLVNEVMERKAILKNPLGANLTHAMKQNAWQNIADTVSFASGIRRSVEDVREKLKQLKCKAKKEHSKRKKQANATGGGPPPPELLPWEDKLLDYIGEVSLDGIVGGIDTGMPTTTTTSATVNVDPEQFALETLAGLATGFEKIPCGMFGLGFRDFPTSIHEHSRLLKDPSWNRKYIFKIST